VIRTTVLAGALAALSGAAALAADLVEPWAPGLTNLELHAARADGARRGEVAGVVGFGVGGAVSLGLLFAEGADDGNHVGAVAVVTRALAGGHAVDGWIEVGRNLTARDAELGSTSVTVGGEWSVTRRRATPYLRFSAAREAGDTAAHPLAGVRLALGARVQLHLELSSHEPARGAWPVHVAVGPNVLLGEAAKLVPELSWVRDRAAGRDEWAISLGVVLDPRLPARRARR